MYKFQTFLIRFSGAVSAASLLFLLLLVSWGVFSRYILRSPSLIALEISGYAMVLLTFVPAGYLAYKNQHVSSEFFVSRLSRGGKQRSKFISNLFVLLYCIIIFYEGVKSVIIMYQGDFRSTTLLNFPTWIVYLLIPFGISFLILQIAAVIINPTLEDKNKQL